MCVLDHHHRGVDHRADGDGNTTQRQDVRIDALVGHDNECHQHAQRKRHDSDERGTQMKEE